MVWSDAHLHVMTNHLPLIGTAAAVLAILVGILFQQRAIVRTGLFLIVVFTAFTGLVMGTGEEAALNFEEGVITANVDAETLYWVQQHDDAAHFTGKIYYGLLVLAALGLIQSAFKKEWTNKIGLIILAVALIALGLSVDVASTGGKIRHPEFRTKAEQAEAARAIAVPEEVPSAESPAEQ